MIATVQPAAAESPSDAIQVGSVWRCEDPPTTLTIYERQADHFRARFERLPHGFIREPAGSVKDDQISWLAKDVNAIRGGPGDDNIGKIIGNRIDLTWSGDGFHRHLQFIRVSPEVSGSNRPSVDVVSDNPMSTIEVLSKQAPNALEWALAPLDQTTPPDIRQNVTFLREDMLDEEVKKPAASGAAYKLGAALCNDLLETLNERDKMRVRAGYTAAQSKVNMGEITNQALEARRSAAPSGWRNHGAAAMAWPTYQREKDQREELRKARQNSAALENQRPILEWADRSAQIRRVVDALYAQYRQAARGPKEK